MKRWILLILLIVLAGCSAPPLMSNDDIIKETKKCESAGLSARPLYDINTMRIVGIQCAPKGL